MTSAPRTVAVWCPDWPVTTARLEAGLSADEPIAVVTANHVVACSHGARSAGVRRGLRRREAQSRCPNLAVLARNEAAEARTFEPVVADPVAPRLQTAQQRKHVGAGGAGGVGGLAWAAVVRAVTPASIRASAASTSFGFVTLNIQSNTLARSTARDTFPDFFG